MDEKTIERIFDPFFTTKEIGRGTGLGLASAYGIIQSHNGFIKVQSEKTKGTTFTVYIPASDKKVMHVERISDDLIKGSGNILLVDDEDVIIDVGKEILEVLGYKVFVAKSGHEAIRVLNEMREEIDLVILDMIMPGMSGGETFDAIKLMNSNIKVVLSSGYSLDTRHTKKLDRSYDGFIQKPYDITTLSQKVKNVLDRK
jgi:CheY-like chemotaxis protein